MDRGVNRFDKLPGPVTHLSVCVYGPVFREHGMQKVCMTVENEGWTFLGSIIGIITIIPIIVAGF